MPPITVPLTCGCIRRQGAPSVVVCDEALALDVAYKSHQDAFWAAINKQVGTVDERTELGRRTLEALWALQGHLGLRGRTAVALVPAASAGPTPARLVV